MTDFVMPLVPKNFRNVCKTDALSGLVSEAVLAQLVKDCHMGSGNPNHPSYAKRVAALRTFTNWLHGSNQLLSDLLTYDGALDAIIKSRDEMGIELSKIPKDIVKRAGYESNWAFGHTLVEKLTQQPSPFTTRNMGYLPQSNEVGAA